MPLRQRRIPRNETPEEKALRLEREADLEAIRNGRTRATLRATSHAHNIREYKTDLQEQADAEKQHTNKAEKADE